MPYHTNEQLEAAIQEGASEAGDRASLLTIGETVGGRPIGAITFAAPGRVPERKRPQAQIIGNVHGNEVISSEVALAVVERLAAVEPDGAAASLLEAADVTVVPAVNLDSRAPASDRLARGSFWSRAPRGNGRGVDLNRNFPFPKGARDLWYPLSGTTASWLPWYRGENPLSEPEAAALADVAQRLRPKVSISLHSVGRFFLYPYCYSYKIPAHLDDFRAMGRAFASAQPRLRYRARQSRSWYAILGAMDDWLYDELGTLAVTVELSTLLSGTGGNPARLFCPLAWMNPVDPRSTIENTLEACLASMAEGVQRRAGVGGSGRG